MLFDELGTGTRLAASCPAHPRPWLRPCIQLIHAHSCSFIHSAHSCSFMLIHAFSIQRPWLRPCGHSGGVAVAAEVQERRGERGAPSRPLGHPHPMPQRPAQAAAVAPQVRNHAGWPTNGRVNVSRSDRSAANPARLALCVTATPPSHAVAWRSALPSHAARFVVALS